jgi:hypothetical protein
MGTIGYNGPCPGRLGTNFQINSLGSLPVTDLRDLPSVLQFTEPGDTIYVLYGTSSSFVLRECGPDSGLNQEHQLFGKCYLCGRASNSGAEQNPHSGLIIR